MATFPNVNDMNVQFPNRYRMKAPDDVGEGEVVDLVPEYGSVVDPGTPLDSVLFGGIKEYVEETRDLVDRLGASTAHLASGTDLNTVRQPGVYSLNGAWSYQNPAPISWGFLYVTATNTGAWVRQVMVNSNATYERFYANGAWNGWTRLVTTDSGWVRIPSSDSSYYNSYAYVRRVGDVVYLRGNLSRADSKPLEAGWTPGIIPAGYRPSVTSVVLCGGANVTGNTAVFKVTVSATDGMITIRSNLGSNGSSSLYLDGLSWAVN